MTEFQKQRPRALGGGEAVQVSLSSRKWPSRPLSLSPL